MARAGYADTDRQCREIVFDVRNHVFKSVYLLMGAEPWYPEKVCDEIIANALEEEERDFNQLICYGSDVDAETVVTAARRFPMMAERQLVVVKEAQAMHDLEELAVYCTKPLESTILVLLLHGASVDKRKSLYKSVMKEGVVLDSPELRDYEVPSWISSHYSSLGISIDPEAAALLAESAGTDLSRIAVETDKLLKNLPEGTTRVSVEDIETNVGISREFSIFELTRALSYGRREDALRLAARIGQTAKFALPAATAPLFNHFYRVLRYVILLSRERYPSPQDKAAVLGVNPFFFKEYDAAAKTWPLSRCMAAISLITEYDYRGKGGEGGEATDAELLSELVAKLLNS
ncbi:MAG: DNA polymerase III subunit delta [Bacteroidales bacterium]|nr:DNA polymerase III subunit delta [Bacteroidales bacterium]